MSEMVERIAKAIEVAFEREGRVFDAGQAETLAHAAIEAMREPTEAMMTAGCFEGIGRGTAQFVWRDMVDEALK